MRTGTLRRQPFFDPDLVDFLARVSPDQLCRGGRSKGLVRDEVAGRCPGLGFERQRKVVGTSLVVGRMRREMAAAWGRLGGPRVLGELGIVDPGALVNLQGEVATGVADAKSLYRSWAILGAEVWAREQIEGVAGRRLE